ncbi:hypothetical protein ACQKFL_23990 [Vreelandella titanicae]|uniref:hypothetical protein n=1 Tax=Vreelandella titanicae TaxID=664683 RepID=UPI003D0283FA|tara:strand:- start:8297 stop:8671 length:375 start_codon:yes stop_codon:yes gene_type:complete
MFKQSITVNELPEDVQAELLQLRNMHPSMPLNSHLSWLRGKGYEVSRASLARFFDIKGVALNSEWECRRQLIDAAERRREMCLEMANRVYVGNDPKELIAIAEDFLSWIEETEISHKVPPEASL